MAVQAAPAQQRTTAIRAIKLLLFSASIVPCLVGGALAASLGNLNIARFALVTLALFLGQAGGDYLYYYFTHFHSDARDAHTKIFAGWRPLFTDNMIPGPATIYAGFACLAVAAAIGLYFAVRIGWPVVALGLAGGAVAVFFTPLMLRGYKEPVIFLTFGPLTLAGVHLVLTNALSWTPVIVSLPIAFFVTVVAYLKGARITVRPGGAGDATVDVEPWRMVLLYTLGYACLVGGVAAGVMPRGTLLALVSAPLAFSVVNVLKSGSSDSTHYLWATVRSIAVLIIAGAGMALGFIV